MTALYKPTKADDLRFYNWAKVELEKKGINVPVFNGGINRAFYIWALGEVCGWSCYLCQGKKCKYIGKRHKWIREHKNGHADDFSPLNLGITSNKCNQKKRYKQASGGSTGNLCECVETDMPDKEQIRQSKIRQRQEENNLQRAAMEIQINRNSEPRFRRYLWQNYDRKGGLTVTDLIYEGSEYAECSPETARRHFYKATSNISPFDTTEINAIEIVIRRTGYKPNLETRLGRLDAEMMQSLDLDKQEGGAN